MTLRTMALPLLVCAALLAGCAAPRVSNAPLEIRLAHVTPEPGFALSSEKDDGVPLYLAPTAVITAQDIAKAQVVKVQVVTPGGSVTRKGEISVIKKTAPGVAIKLSRAARRRLSAALDKEERARLAVLYNKRLIAVLPVKGEVERDMLIVGSFTEEEAKDLADALMGRKQSEGSSKGEWKIR